MRTALVLLFAFFGFAAAVAQDIRGLENCSAEKQMERRTGCLQANVEFLQQEMRKQTADARQKQVALEKDLAAAKSDVTAAQKDVAALKDTIGKMQTALDELQKTKKDGK
jgi:septal ring factor EnvC (AmiA/AmiB activator)